MDVLVTCKYQEDPIKNEGARVDTLYSNFSDAQGQITLQSLVRSGQISNSFEMLWMFSIPASMKKIRSKMKALEWTQHFPHITLWELSVALETRVPILPGPKPNAINHPPQ